MGQGQTKEEPIKTMNIEKARKGELARVLQSHLEKAEKVVGDPGKVVLVLDLDETTFTVKSPEESTFGSAVWLADIVEEYQEIYLRNGMYDVQPAVLDMCDVLLGHIPVQPCDTELAQIVENWQDRGATVIAATARMNSLSHGTQQQLKHIPGLNFCDQNPNQKRISQRLNSIWKPQWEGWPGVHHEKGIWFLSMANKGMFLQALLDPDRAAVFADDTLGHLITSQESLTHLPYHSCVHYTGAVDECKKHHSRAKSSAAMAALLAKLHHAGDAPLQGIIKKVRTEPFLRLWVDRNVAAYPELLPLHGALKN